MIQLAKDFYIVSIEKNNWTNSRLENNTTYTFKYKNYKLELRPSFDILGYTKEDNMAILNFGYVLEIEKWLNRYQDYRRIRDVNAQDGSSTKKYFDSQEAREIILRFIEKFIYKHLNKVSPAIILRGALSDIKAQLPRYARMDKQFFMHAYIKKEFDVKMADSLYQITMSKEDTDKTLWVYCKKECYFEQLNEVL